MVTVKKKRKECGRQMTNKSVTNDLDDLIFGSTTLIPSER